MAKYFLSYKKKQEKVLRKQDEFSCKYAYFLQKNVNFAQVFYKTIV